jgi:hypothetical protein
MSRERELIKKNYSFEGDEEETYNNLESFQGMMKEVKQEIPKEEMSPRDSYGVNEEAYQEVKEMPSDYSEEEKNKKNIKKKKLTKRRKKDSEDFDDEEDYHNYERDDVIESEEEDSDHGRKFTKKKRQRQKNSKISKSKKKKKGIRGGIDEFIEREAESESEEESDEEGGEITKEQQEKLLKEIHERRDRTGTIMPARKRLDLLEQ